MLRTANDGLGASRAVHADGLKKVRELRPAAITLDITMPDVDGWTVLAALKGDPALADIPVVIVTSSTSALLGETRKAQK